MAASSRSCDKRRPRVVVLVVVVVAEMSLVVVGEPSMQDLFENTCFGGARRRGFRPRRNSHVFGKRGDMNRDDRIADQSIGVDVKPSLSMSRDSSSVASVDTNTDRKVRAGNQKFHGATQTNSHAAQNSPGAL